MLNSLWNFSTLRRRFWSFVCYFPVAFFCSFLSFLLFLSAVPLFCGASNKNIVDILEHATAMKHVNIAQSFWYHAFFAFAFFSFFFHCCYLFRFLFVAKLIFCKNKKKDFHTLLATGVNNLLNQSQTFKVCNTCTYHKSNGQYLPKKWVRMILFWQISRRIYNKFSAYNKNNSENSLRRNFNEKYIKRFKS